MITKFRTLILFLADARSSAHKAVFVYNYKSQVFVEKYS